MSVSSVRGLIVFSRNFDLLTAYRGRALGVYVPLRHTRANPKLKPRRFRRT